MLEEKKLLIENQLRLLAASLGIEVAVSDINGFKNKHGWKTGLAKKLKVGNVNTISTWIRRGIPPARILEIDKVGIPREKWLRDEITQEMIKNAVLRKDPDKGHGGFSREEMATAVMDKEIPKDRVAKLPENDYDPFIRAVSGLKKIFDSGDTRVTETLLSNIAALGTASELLIKYRSLEKKVANLIKEHKPPEGKKERRKAWIVMKKAVELE